MFEQSVIDDIRADAAARYPEESCGFVVDDQYLPQVNIVTEADHRRAAFRIAAEAWVKYGKAIQAVVHSHPDGHASPSGADMMQQSQSGLPWGVVASHATGTGLLHWWGPGAPVAPLMDRYFVHGIHDCFGFGRDWFREKRGVEIPDFARDWDWWRGRGVGADGKGLYLEKFREAGFEKIGWRDAGPGDVLLVSIKSEHPNHCMICEGNQTIVHHLARSTSPVDQNSRPIRSVLQGPLLKKGIWLRHVG